MGYSFLFLSYSSHVHIVIYVYFFNIDLHLIVHQSYTVRGYLPSPRPRYHSSLVVMSIKRVEFICFL